MPYYEDRDAAAVDFDKQAGIKNRWKWQWLAEKSKHGVPHSVWCKKPKKAGYCYCLLCNSELKYGSIGKRRLQDHTDDTDHKKALEAQKTAISVASETSTGAPSLYGRIADSKAILLAFVAERNLPLSIIPELIQLCQKLAEDKSALKRISMSRTCGSYTLTHGLASGLRKELHATLRKAPFSLNVDEATDNAMDKIVNMIVQFYDEDQDEVVVQHLASAKTNIATAENIFLAITDALIAADVPLSNLVSCLMDNCATMRGVRTGVEKRLRDEQPSLLDIAGDTVHIVSNAAKALFAPFHDYCENMCGELFYDVEKSPKAGEILGEIQELLGVEVSSKNASGILHLLRHCPSRFLNMQKVTERVHQLLDSLTIFYYSFLSTPEQQKHRPLLEDILSHHDVQSDEKELIEAIQTEQGKQSRTSAGDSRKDRILTALFHEREKFVTHLNLYRGLLPTFEAFVKKFQCTKPIIHKLHAEMFEICRSFFALFLKPENIPEDNIKDLLELRYKDEGIHLPKKSLCVGRYSHLALMKARKDKSKEHWVNELYSNLRKGYVAGAQMLMKLPLGNKTITRLSCLDPCAHGEATTNQALYDLAASLPTVILETDLGTLDMELKGFCVDKKVKVLVEASTFSDSRIDRDFWRHVFALQGSDGSKYPILAKLVKALLSVFAGPVVESSFNIMDDIIRSDRSKLTVENYEALAFVKSSLRAKSVSATKMPVSKETRDAIISAKANYKTFLQEKKAKRAAAKLKRLERLRQRRAGKNSRRQVIRCPATGPVATYPRSGTSGAGNADKAKNKGATIGAGNDSGVRDKRKDVTRPQFPASKRMKAGNTDIRFFCKRPQTTQ